MLHFLPDYVIQAGAQNVKVVYHGGVRVRGGKSRPEPAPYSKYDHTVIPNPAIFEG